MNRSTFFHRIAAGTIGAVVAGKEALAVLPASGIAQELLYIGRYTETNEEGIPVAQFDPAVGKIVLTGEARKVSNPSFLTYGRSRDFLYAVIETDDFGGKASGAVSAFRVNRVNGELTPLNTVASQGAHPCHVSIDRAGRYLLVANYTGGNVAVLPVRPDGTLGEAVDLVQHSGSGPNHERQESAHAHSVNLSSDNRFAFVCDLGIDKVMIYRFEERTGKLTPADTPFLLATPGAGPRHFTFTPDGQHAFVVNELNSTLSLLKYEAETGKLTELHTISTLSAGFTGDNTCADVHVHPSGMYVYASNRGEDSIAIFRIDLFSKQLQWLANQPTLGNTPRNFLIHPTGRFLLVANQNSNNLVTFAIDIANGSLKPIGSHVTVGKPVCLLL